MANSSSLIRTRVNRTFAAELLRLCRGPGVLPDPANFKEALEVAKQSFGCPYVKTAKQAGLPVKLLDVWQASPDEVHPKVRQLVLELMYRVISDEALILTELESVALPTTEQFKVVLEAARCEFPGKFSASIRRTGIPVKLLDRWKASPDEVHPKVRQLIFDFLHEDGISTMTPEII